MVTTRASQSVAEPAAAAVSAQVADILQNIKNTSTTPAAATPVETATVTAAKSAAKTGKKLPKKAATVPRGIAKSGRPWKEVKQKFANIKKSIYRPPTEKKHAFREEMKHIKELSKSIVAEKKQENENKRLRREQNAQRKQENQRKSEIVQVIKNPAKLKRMKKKAMRMIEKRDLSQVKTV